MMQHQHFVWEGWNGVNPGKLLGCVIGACSTEVAAGRLTWKIQSLLCGMAAAPGESMQFCYRSMERLKKKFCVAAMWIMEHSH